MKKFGRVCVSERYLEEKLRKFQRTYEDVKNRRHQEDDNLLEYLTPDDVYFMRLNLICVLNELGLEIDADLATQALRDEA